MVAPLLLCNRAGGFSLNTLPQPAALAVGASRAPAAGKVTAEIAQAHAESEFEKYRIVQDRLFESDFDEMIKKLPPEGDKP
jgi:hypothetical protein